MKHAALFFFLLLTFTACKESKKDLISRKWHATSVESPVLDEEVAQQRRFFDTVGKSGTPEENQQRYGVRNMDSMRRELHIQLDSMIALQKASMTQTWMDFKKEGTVIADFGNGADTVSWYFEDDGSLILDEMKKKGTGSKIKMEVIHLSKEKLQLRFNENGFSSTASFEPAK